VSKAKSQMGARASRVPPLDPTPADRGAVKGGRRPAKRTLDGREAVEHPPRYQTAMFGGGEVCVDVATSSDTNNTPVWLCDLVVEFFGGPPDVDPCTNQWATMPAKNRYTLEDDGLAQDWGVGTSVWCNPPYSDPFEFARRMGEHVGLGLALYRHDHSTAWWHAFVKGRARCGFDRRLEFYNPARKKSTGVNFTNTLVLHGQPTLADLRRFTCIFAPHGEILIPLLPSDFEKEEP